MLKYTSISQGQTDEHFLAHFLVRLGDQLAVKLNQLNIGVAKLRPGASFKKCCAETILKFILRSSLKHAYGWFIKWTYAQKNARTRLFQMWNLWIANDFELKTFFSEISILRKEKVRPSAQILTWR